jgi:bifunctional UDP-N-acetylglucosamine pyrophosphorylase/glucosamine-1-phosphate N-acetyltransferase
MNGLLAIVLAGGLGKRMKSRVPKILHEIAGRPLVHYPIAAALEAGADHVVVVASPTTKAAVDEYVLEAFSAGKITTAVQEEARGTGDAARVGLAARRSSEERVLVLCGDTPLLRATDLMTLLDELTDSTSLALLSAEPADPTGYGRVMRGPNGRVLSVQEHKDLNPDERATHREVNAGVYAAVRTALEEGLATLKPNNAQGEYYLTDVVAFAARKNGAIAVKGSADALVGVNDRAQLAQAEEAIFRRIADRHRIAGVTVSGDAHIDDEVTIGEDARVAAGVHLRGHTRIGAGAVLDVGVVIADSSVGEGALIKPYSVVTESSIGARAQIGPFAHVRPASRIEDEAHIGNFVETKKTRVGRGAKANHLAYLGDGDIGAGANIGAGTIFCNYDGFRKHVTQIGEGAFIGSDSQLVAPVTIGEGAYVATGTTVTKDVPADALAISRTKQENKLGYASRLRGRLAPKK